MTEPETIEEYAHSCRIVREQDDLGEDTYHYEGPLGRVKSFHSVDKARLYADVHTVVGGIREEKTGGRGHPLLAFLLNPSASTVRLTGLPAGVAGGLPGRVRCVSLRSHRPLPQSRDRPTPTAPEGAGTAG